VTVGRQHLAQGFRLSPGQRRLWAFQREDSAFPQRAACVVSVTGPLDVPRLVAALEAVVGRHEALRSRFLLPHGASEPMQAVESTDVRVRSTVVHADPREILRRVLRVPVQDGGGAVDVSVCRVSETEHQLVLEVPSLGVDRRSLGLAIRELEAAYAEETGGGEAQGAIQCADVAEWQNQALSSDDARPGREFWRRREGRLTELPRLPDQGPCSRRAEFEPRSRPVRIPASTLLELAGEWDVPARSLLLASWQAFVARVTGRPDTVVGVTLDGRAYQELEAAVGLLAVHVPVCVRLPEEISFRQTVARAVDEFRESEHWQECFSWERVPDGVAATVPFGFEWREALPASSESRETSMTIEAAAACTDRTEVRLVGVAGNRDVAVELEHDAASVSREVGARLAARFETFCADALARPDEPIGALELLPGAERAVWLDEFNVTSTGERSPRGEAAFHRSFERQAAATPSNVALKQDGKASTYREVNGLADTLAAALRDRGVTTEDRVAVLASPSETLLVALLAAMKAGAACVPLDPAWPSRRTAQVIRDAAPRVVLAHSSSRSRLPSVRTDVVFVDAVTDEPGVGEDHPRDGAVDPDRAAYVSYAWDEAGRPRGTVITHRGLTNYLGWCVRSYGRRTLRHPGRGPGANAGGHDLRRRPVQSGQGPAVRAGGPDPPPRVFRPLRSHGNAGARGRCRRGARRSPVADRRRRHVGHQRARYPGDVDGLLLSRDRRDGQPGSRSPHRSPHRQHACLRARSLDEPGGAGATRRALRRRRGDRARLLRATRRHGRLVRPRSVRSGGGRSTVSHR
jgi:hypothetical protein